MTLPAEGGEKDPGTEAAVEQRTSGEGGHEDSPSSLPASHRETEAQRGEEPEARHTELELASLVSTT